MGEATAGPGSAAPVTARRGLPERLAPRLPFFYGWVIVAVGGLALLAGGPGQSSTIATLMEPMLAELGLGRTGVSAAFTVGSLVAAVAMGPVGRLTDRLGGRRLLLVGAAALGATCLGMTAVQGLAGLAVGFALLRLLVQGPITLTGTTLLAQWFVRGRGGAQSLMSLGLTLAFAVFPPLAQALIDRFGWRAAWVALGLIVWALTLPAIALLVRDRPEALGLRPDGAPDGAAPPLRGALAVATLPEGADWTAHQATRTPTFWLLTAAIAVTWLVGAGLNFHQVGILTEAGLSAQFAATIYSVAALVSVPATFLTGYLIDRQPARRLLVGMLLIQALAAWWLIGVDAPAPAVAYGALNGVMIGCSSVVNAVIFAAYYGRNHLGSIRGVTMIANVGASAIGPFPLGLARDLLGTYTPALLVLGALPLLVAVALRWARPPGPP